MDETTITIDPPIAEPVPELAATYIPTPEELAQKLSQIHTVNRFIADMQALQNRTADEEDALQRNIAFVTNESIQPYWSATDDLTAVDTAGENVPLKERRTAAKVKRAAAVSSIVVTTSTGKSFDGHEEAQARMSRAMLGMQAAQILQMPWTLADNTIELVTAAELTEAMILAGTQQSALWPLEQYM